VTLEEYPDHLQMTVGDSLVKGRNTVRVRNVHVHIRMREKMQNSLEKKVKIKFVTKSQSSSR
jgi:hypothetical protein